MADTKDSTSKKAAVKRPPPTHPKWYDMVVEAVTKTDDTKGASIQAIKKYISGTYPSADTGMMKTQIKRALEKGLLTKVLKRPKAFEENSVMLSRFKLDKAVIAAEEKAKAKKEKKAEKAKEVADKKKAVVKKKASTTTKKTVKAETVKKSAKSSKPKTVTTPKAARPKPKKAEMKTPKKPKSAAAKSRVSASEKKPKAAAKKKATPKKAKGRTKS